MLFPGMPELNNLILDCFRELAESKDIIMYRKCFHYLINTEKFNRIRDNKVALCQCLKITTDCLEMSERANFKDSDFLFELELNK